uniref:Uncharacterized protein n=1 Tax=Rhizophora mucronata TaxID=61149 RepID=A0A2P2QS40_RHIMU
MGLSFNFHWDMSVYRDAVCGCGFHFWGFRDSLLFFLKLKFPIIFAYFGICLQL